MKEIYLLIKKLQSFFHFFILDEIILLMETNYPELQF